MRLVPTDVFGTAFLMGLAALLNAFLGCEVTFCVAFFSCFVPPCASTFELSGKTPQAKTDRSQRAEGLCASRKVINCNKPRCIIENACHGIDHERGPRSPWEIVVYSLPYEQVTAPTCQSYLE